MTNQEILTKAIRKAIDGGWLPYFAHFDNKMTKDTILFRLYEGSNSVNFDYQYEGHIVGVSGYSLERASVIFNHDFAKALWPGYGPAMKPLDKTAYHPAPGEWTLPEPDNRPAWQYHLQQMVITDDPVRYLGEHLDD